MFSAQLSPHLMLYLAAALLLATAGLRREQQDWTGFAPGGWRTRIGGRGAFSLVFSSPLHGLIAVLLILLNVVNTVGEFILSDLVAATEAGRTDPSFDTVGTVSGAFLWQLLPLCESPRGGAATAPRLIKKFGLAGVLFALPFIALGAYGIVAFSTPMGEDGGELDRLLGHEYRQAVAVAADVA